MVHACQRPAQRQEQGLALAPAGLFQGRSQRRPVGPGCVQQAGGLGQVGAVIFIDRRGVDGSGDHAPPACRLVHPRQVGAHRQPAGLAHAFRQAVRHFGIGQLVDDPGVEAGQFLLVEPGRGTAEGGKIEGGQQRGPVSQRLHRQGRAQPRQQGNQCSRFDPLFAEGIAAQRAEPLGQLALAAHQQRLVREGGRRGAQRGEHLQLHGGVGYVVLAAQHLGHAHGDVIDHRGEHIEPRAIGPPHHRIGQLRGDELLRPAHAVHPGNRLVMVKQEAPVRRLARRCPGRMVGFGQGQGGAVIDRRQAAPQRHLALEVQFLRAFIAAIDPARGLQPLEGFLVQRQPRRLPLLAIGGQAQPGKVSADAIDELLLAARRVGIVDPQQEAAAPLLTAPLRQHPVVQRRAQVAHVQVPGGRRRETGDDGGSSDHAAPVSPARTIRPAPPWRPGRRP